MWDSFVDRRIPDSIEIRTAHKIRAIASERTIGASLLTFVTVWRVFLARLDDIVSLCARIALQNSHTACVLAEMQAQSILRAQRSMRVLLHPVHEHCEA